MSIEETWNGVDEALENHKKILELCKLMEIPAAHFGLTDASKEGDGTTSSSVVGTLEEIQRMFALFAYKEPEIATVIMVAILAGLHYPGEEDDSSMPN